MKGFWADSNFLTAGNAFWVPGLYQRWYPVIFSANQVMRSDKLVSYQQPFGLEWPSLFGRFLVHSLSLRHKL